MVLLSAKSTNYVLNILSAVGCMRSAQALECKLIVPVKWVSWNGNTNLFEQLSINKVLGVGGEKGSFSVSALALWRKLSPSGPLTLTAVLAPEGSLPLWLPSYLLLDFCPSCSQMHTGLFSSDSPSLFPSSQTLWTFTWKWILSRQLFMAGSSETFPSEKPSLRFPLFCCPKSGFCSLSPLSLSHFGCGGILFFRSFIPAWSCSAWNHRNVFLKTRILPTVLRIDEDKEGGQELPTVMAYGAFIIWNSKARLLAPSGKKEVSLFQALFCACVINDCRSPQGYLGSCHSHSWGGGGGTFTGLGLTRNEPREPQNRKKSGPCEREPRESPYFLRHIQVAWYWQPQPSLRASWAASQGYKGC